MNKKKKRLIIGVVIVCTAVLIGIYNIRKFREKYTICKFSQDINTIQYVEFDQDTGEICMILSGKYCRLLSGNIFNGKYIYTKDFYYFFRHPTDKIVVKKAEVNIYNLETMELIKTIDIKKILKEYQPERGWTGRFRIIQIEGGDIWASTASREGWDIPEVVYINLITDEIIVLRSEEMLGGMEKFNEGEEDREKDSKMCDKLLDEDEIGIVERNGLPGNIQTVGTDGALYTCVLIPKESLPTGDIRLYQKFPGLKDYEMSDDETLSICLKTTESVTEEIIELFLEEGQEISFEGCVLPAELSIDGVEHDISSFEDYYRWRDWDIY